MKLLVIGYVWPEPDSSAAGRHMLSLLRLFKQQGWLIEFASPAQTTKHMIDLASEGIGSKSIVLNCDSFDEYVIEYQPDLVLFDRFMMEEQFAWRVEKHCPNALKILDTEDLQCLRQARHQAIKAERDVEPADLFSDLAKREIAAILRCDLSLIISSYEMQLLKNTYNVDASLLHYLPFMVDLKSCPSHTLSYSKRQHFISIGNFRHAPNWDMVLQLQKIWPLIRKKIPLAECHIYGAYPPEKATALNNAKTGFLIKGWAEDCYLVMQQAKICLAPIRFGAGIKGKLLDAMIMQTPSITSTIGSEGMLGDLLDETSWPGSIADKINDFAEAAIDLYNDENAWLNAQQKTGVLLKSCYDSDQHGPELCERIKQLKNNLPAHRLNNFTGAMLKHHSMASTQYMSQWITEKNKHKGNP